MSVSSKKLEIRYVLLTAFATVIGLVIQGPFFYANAETTTQATSQSYEFTTLTGDEIKNNPIAQKILKNIEISKQRIAELQKRQNEMTEQQKFIEEQRKIAKEMLDQDLKRMNKEQEPYTPRNSFASFVAGVNSTYSGIFWDEFNYLDQKIQLARQAMNTVLQNGGSYEDARQEYFKYAALTRQEMIEVNKNLNIKYGFADPEVQKIFDKNGRHPRPDTWDT